MNEILALLISKEFCVETVIVKHTSLLASLPCLSVFTKCITLESTSLHLVTVYITKCALILLFFLHSRSYLHGKTLKQREGRRDSMLRVWDWPC